jgi:hypothetical protein
MQIYAILLQVLSKLSVVGNSSSDKDANGKFQEAMQESKPLFKRANSSSKARMLAYKRNVRES